VLSGLEQLTQMANQRGDGLISSAISSAVLALEAGITPSPLNPSIRGSVASYVGLVVVTSVALPSGSVTVRNLVAWDTQAGIAPDVLVASLGQGVADSAAVEPPAPSAPPTNLGQIASAVWFDARDPSSPWTAASGKVGVVPLSRLGKCSGAAIEEVSCTTATFAVMVDGRFVRTESTGQVRALDISARAASVNGATLERRPA